MTKLDILWLPIIPRVDVFTTAEDHAVAFGDIIDVLIMMAQTNYLHARFRGDPSLVVVVFAAIGYADDDVGFHFKYFFLSDRSAVSCLIGYT